MTPYVAALENAAMWRRQGNVQKETHWLMVAMKAQNPNYVPPKDRPPYTPRERAAATRRIEGETTAQRVLSLVTRIMTTAEVSAAAGLSINHTRKILNILHRQGKLSRDRIGDYLLWTRVQ